MNQLYKYGLKRNPSYQLQDKLLKQIKIVYNIKDFSCNADTLERNSPHFPPTNVLSYKLDDPQSVMKNVLQLIPYENVLPKEVTLDSLYSNLEWKWGCNVKIAKKIMNKLNELGPKLVWGKYPSQKVKDKLLLQIQTAYYIKDFSCNADPSKESPPEFRPISELDDEWKGHEALRKKALQQIP